MSKSFKNFLKHTAKDFHNQSVNPPVVRASTIIFKSMQDIRKTQAKALKNPVGGYYDYDQKVWNWSDGSLWNYTNWVDSPGGNQFLQIVEEYEGWSKDGEWTTIKEISSTSWKRYWRGSVCQYY